MDVGPRFDNPVIAGEPHIQHAVFDVARHLLGADQQALDLVVVDGGKVIARTKRDTITGRRNNSEVASCRLPAGIPRWRMSDMRKISIA